MRSKKGDVELSTGTLVGIILLLIVCGLITMKIAKGASSYKFEKLFLSKDTAMFVDTLYVSPNKIVVNYPHSSKAYNFIFEKNKAESFRNFLWNSIRIFLCIIVPLLIIAAIIEGFLIVY